MEKNELLKKRFEFFDHTADALFRAYGKNMSEAFSNAVLALTAIMTDVELVSPNRKKTIVVESRNEEALLYDFLEEIVYLVDAENFFVSKIENMKMSCQAFGCRLEAEIFGDDASKYKVYAIVKAITYNQMAIVKEQDFVTVQVVPDL